MRTRQSAWEWKARTRGCVAERAVSPGRSRTRVVRMLAPFMAVWPVVAYLAAARAAPGGAAPVTSAAAPASAPAAARTPAPPAATSAQGATTSAVPAAARSTPTATPTAESAATRLGFPRQMSLSFVRGPGAGACPSQEDFTNQLTVQLGAAESPFADGAKARLVVTLEADPGRGYRGRNEVFGEDGTLVSRREIGPVRDCAELAGGLVLSFAVHWQTWQAALAAVRTSEAAGGNPPEGAAPPTREPPAAPQGKAQASRPPPSITAPGRLSSPRLTPPPVRPQVCKLLIGGYCLPVDIYSFGFSAGALMTMGFTADVGPGAYLGAEIRPFEAFSFELQLRGVFPARVVAADPIDPTKPYETPKEPDFSGVTMLLVPCFRYSYFMGCGVAQFGFNVWQTPADIVLGPSIGAGPRIGVEIPFLERFAVRVWGDVIFQIPNTHRLDDVNLQWTQSPVVGMLGAGLAVHFK